METTRRLVRTGLPFLLSKSSASMKPSESVDKLVASSLKWEAICFSESSVCLRLNLQSFRRLDRCNNSEVLAMTPDVPIGHSCLEHGQ
jgi:hypothetical protein